MRIRLLKAAMVDVLRPRMWEGEVPDALGQSIINNGRAVRIDKPEPKPRAKAKTKRTARKESG